MFPGGARGALLRLDAERRLTLKKSWRDTPLQEIGGQFRLNTQKTNIIIAAESSLAYTAVLPLQAARENKEPIGSVEIENFLAQGIGKIFNQCRGDAARELGSDELDVMVLRSRASDFKIDGHRVVNPLGFTGKKIEAALELTLTVRDVVLTIKSFLKSPRPFFFTEQGRSVSLAIQRIVRPPFGILTFEDTQSSYAATGGAFPHTFSRGELLWRAGEFYKVIAKSFGVTDLAARQIYGIYCAKSISPRFAKYIEKLLSSIIQDFFLKIGKSKLAGPIYLDSTVPLPFTVPCRKGGVRLEQTPLPAILAHFGLTIKRSVWPMSDGGILGYIAPCIEFYYDTSDPTINHWLRRHLNWLGSSL